MQNTMELRHSCLKNSLDLTKYCTCHEKWQANSIVTWRNCYWTELFLDWTDPWLYCYFSELFLDDCYVTKLFLDWTVTLLNYYLAELLLNWTVTWRNSCLPELLLDWTSTWTVTLLNCDLTELFASLKLRVSEVSQLNFLWQYHSIQWVFQ